MSKITKMKRGEGGVTLIELGVVMAMVAILALFVAPAIGQWLDNFRIRQGARDISSTMQQAKMQAISTKTQQTVTFDTNNDTYVFSGENKAVPRGVNIVTGSTATVDFFPNGTSSSGSITIDNEDGRQFQIDINGVGRISMQEL